MAVWAQLRSPITKLWLLVSSSLGPTDSIGPPMRCGEMAVANGAEEVNWVGGLRWTYLPAIFSGPLLEPHCHFIIFPPFFLIREQKEDDSVAYLHYLL